MSTNSLWDRFIKKWRSSGLQISPGAPVVDPGSLSSRLIRQWRSSGIHIRPEVRAAEISAFEQRYSVVLPPAVHQYFEAVDGTGDDMEGDLCYTFWPLSRVKPVDDELSDNRGVVYADRYAYPQCFVFADHFLDSWFYAVKLTSDSDQPAPVFRVLASDTPGEEMTASFHEFMELYLADPKNIL